MVEMKLSELKFNKFPGPDAIHPRVLKEISSIIIKPVFIIFKTSFELGKIPTL